MISFIDCVRFLEDSAVSWSFTSHPQSLCVLIVNLGSSHGFAVHGTSLDDVFVDAVRKIKEIYSELAR